MCKKCVKKQFIFALAILFLIPFLVIASREDNSYEQHDISVILFGLALILLFARISSLVEYFGQPSVLGELIIGVILGNLGLLGLHFFESFKEDPIIVFLAELGVIILLFQIGLESNIEKMKKVGLRAFLVAVIGVVAPFVLGTYIVGPRLFPNLTFNTYLFLGAALTATSVGITARVFQDFKKLHIPEAQMVLGAAVIDDVLGLIILAVVSAIVTVGTVSAGTVVLISLKAIVFLLGAIILGTIFSPKIGRLLSKIHTGLGMKFTMAMSFCLIFAFLAKKVGLAPIVGAFAAGLVLDSVHFIYFQDPKIIEDIKEEAKNFEQKSKERILSIVEHHSKHHVEDLIHPTALFLVPIFFVFTGMSVNLKTMFNLPILLTALGVTAIAIVGKVISGLVAGKVNKALVGFGMVPRGEVGLIFAIIGKNLNVISDQIFSIIVIMVILTTLLTPPILTLILKRYKEI